ncbi:MULTISPECIES: XrtA/PEP-CTERM system TPR-repeat protein PrsT [unclassified Colwellia]|uniref:XrtA/PEP-CTERM system TPR-repeat protein PrsT n=1 Tax=unclassified Colwellia TaxID=196834 RepID=UPI0015F752D0|nr:MULTISPECIES: XrtA/PEP-CTERM system TPR-repeat protein PrsT [unclassified Colwellia]MBA6231801.1 PEP-CTERM system TPR-repeat protein PrsT [Colwellia sp. MB02u-7]MBA6235756.1 PEP-CTERM system TPR-repeat protein PrsT [Colwellia sp. MB02u-11]MBA6254999.1 PEP-CTERM system TPR-repeat protein PrsT [Colwellia sp. MB3u-28]MBA6259050.1 PEP-CTERM system TPR-repeat protein PrsT [Colwellia sp. MB3u-41]MBA6298845.1 PEP-CTERM system TPR-repeat protein PrsT [Colwellia sp. MB3u-22]
MEKFRKLIISFIPIIIGIMVSFANAEKNHYEAALQAYNQHDIETAYIHLKNALQQGERNLPAKLLLAKVLIDKHSYSAAEQELNDLIKLGVDSNLIVFPLGESILNQSKFKQALIFADQMTLKEEGALAYSHIKARAYISLNNLDNAKIEYQSMLTHDSNNTDALLGLATVYIYQKNNVKAKMLLTKAEKKDPDNGILWQLKGHLARSNSQFSKAIKYLVKANKLDPNNIETLRILISCYVDIENFDMADQFADQVLNIARNDPQTTFMKALILKELNQPELSEKILVELSNQLSKIDESYLLSQPQLLLLDAMSSYAQENWKQAESKFKRYLSQTTAQSEVSEIMLLADVYQQQQEPKHALLLLEKNEKKLIFNKQYALVLAGLYLKFDQNYKADFLLSKLRVDYPQDEAVLILSANVLEASGRVEQALALLEEAKITGSENYQYALSLLSLRIGAFQKSLNYIKPLTNTDPKNISYQLVTAQILIELQRFNQAQEIIEKLYIAQPKNSEVGTSYALLQLNLGKLDIAKEILTNVLKSNKNNNQSALLLAKVEYQLGNKAAAIAGFEQQAKVSSVKTVALTELANIYIAEQKWEDALSVINQILRDNRLDVQALFKKAEVLLASNQPKKSKRKLNILAGLVGKNPPRLMKLSQLQLQVEDFSGAEYSREQALKWAPNSLPIVIELIKIKIQLNKIDEAIKLLAETQRRMPKENVRLTILQGDIFNASNKTLEAFTAYLKAVKQEHNNVIALSKLYQISKGEYLSVKFITELSTLIDKYPELLLHRHLLADHLLENKHFTQAQHQYETLLKNNIPSIKRALALNSLATIYIRDGNYTLAIKTSKHALMLDPSVPAIIDTVGWALVLSEELDLGLSYLRQAFSLSSTSPDIQYHIAYTLLKLKRVDEAKKVLTKLVALPANFEEYQLAKQLLDKLLIK